MYRKSASDNDMAAESIELLNINLLTGAPNASALKQNLFDYAMPSSTGSLNCWHNELPQSIFRWINKITNHKHQRTRISRTCW